MAEIVLFHHAQGLTPGCRAFADDLRAAGHVVHVPDLYEGVTFGSVAEGVAHAEQLGFETILERGRLAADPLPDDLVYTGFSLGVLPAQMLAQTRPGAKGALLVSACIPPSEFDGPWPADVPVQIHGMDSDALFVGEGDIEAAREIVNTTDDAELFLYPGDRHLFADSSLPDYDPAAAALLKRRAIEFIGEID